MSNKIILFDLDNTISDMDHRLSLIDRLEPDWDAFEASCDLDYPIHSTILLMRALHHQHQVWIWTGRSDNVKGKTVKWLTAQGVPYDQLIMRRYGDQRPTVRIKRDWLNDNPVPRDRVLCAFDDDPQIIQMLNSEQVLAYQVKRP